MTDFAANEAGTIREAMKHHNCSLVLRVASGADSVGKENNRGVSVVRDA